MLDYPQQLRLGGERKLADLVQKDGSAGGSLEGALAQGARSGEGAALVTEQLVFHQVLRQRRRVERDKRPGRVRAEAV